MKRFDNLSRAVIPGLLLTSLAYIYLSTIAPGLSWANSGSDGGDLIVAVATGSVAHPSGYPLYLILARLFQSIPVGSLAFRTNLMSAFFAVLTALLVYVIVVRYLRAGSSAHIAGLSAGYAIGLSPLFWSQAVITEVYTLHAFFIVFIIYMTMLSTVPEKFHLDRWRGIVYGLAAANHLTIVFFIPCALMLSSLEPYSMTRDQSNTVKKVRVNWKSLGRQIAWMFIGLSVYALLPLRAMKQPVINWGNPISPESFWWLISGKIYRAHYLQNTFSSLWSRIEASASLLLGQFGLIGLFLGFMGVFFFFKTSKLYILTIWIWLISWLTSIIYQSSDSYVYFIPAAISFSIWIGVCAGFVIEYLKKQKKYLAPLFLSALFISPIFGAVKDWKVVDASQDTRAENFVKEVFNLVPENAIVFAKGDQAVFSLWYFHFALEERTDLIVLATDLLHYDWYQESVKKRYPSLVLPGPFPFSSMVVDANPSRDICYVQYMYQTEIFCKSSRER